MMDKGFIIGDVNWSLRWISVKDFPALFLGMDICDWDLVQNDWVRIKLSEFCEFGIRCSDYKLSRPYELVSWESDSVNAKL